MSLYYHIQSLCGTGARKSGGLKPALGEWGTQKVEREAEHLNSYMALLCTPIQHPQDLSLLQIWDCPQSVLVVH